MEQLYPLARIQNEEGAECSQAFWQSIISLNKNFVKITTHCLE